MFISRLFSDPTMFFTVIIAVGLSVCIHEFCHAYAALKCGDPTAARMGHLTLNPLKQMGVISIIMLLLLGICWGSVPVNPGNLDRKKRIFVSLAGPLANLGLFAIGIIGSVIFIKFGNVAGLKLTVIFATLNMVLFMINIAPVPGFDGGSVFMELVGQEKLYSSELGKGFMLASFLVLFYLIDYIFHWANAATVKAVTVLGNLVV